MNFILTCLMVFFAACLVCGSISYFVILFLAIDKARNEIFYSACGHGMWNLLVVELVTPVVSLLLFLIFLVVLHFFGFYLSSDTAKKIQYCHTFILNIFLLIMGSMIIHESNIALGNPVCSAAMSDMAVSANMGTPLLGKIGLVNGSLSVIISALYIINFFCVCCCNNNNNKN